MANYVVICHKFDDNMMNVEVCIACEKKCITKNICKYIASKFR